MGKLFNNIYKDKKVLVTGHTGFKGSWLITWLSELGTKVIGYSLEPSTEPNLFNVLNIERKITHVIGDINDIEHLNDVFIKHQPDIVFHLAAQPIVRFSYQDPILTFNTNVIGTANILESVRQCNSVKVCVVITTDKSYENKEWVYGYRESDRLGGHDPYSSSKACAEMVVSSYRNSYFNNKSGKSRSAAIASVRAGNVVGGGDWAQDRLIPDCIRFLSNNKPIIIRNPMAIRPWQHVLDPLSGYLWLGALMWKDRTLYSESWNFGPYDDNIINVEDMVNRVIRKWGSGKYKIFLEKDQKLHEANLLKLDISKAVFKLQWLPLIDIDIAIENTINWYRTFYNKNNKDMYNYTVSQILDYIDRAKKANLAWSI